MKRTLFLLILPIIVLLGCKKDQITEEPTGVSMSHHTYLYFKNSIGQNLLNTSIPNSINSNTIEIYDLNSAGQKVLYYDPKMDMPKGFRVQSNSSYGGIMFFSFQGGIKINNKFTRFLKYDNGSEDKLTAEVNSQKILKIWLNDALVGEIDAMNFIEKVDIIK